MSNFRLVLVLLLVTLCLAYPPNVKLVVGIDFGTAYSGYSWAYTDDKDGTPTVTTSWPGAHVPYPKARTALLLSPDLKVLEWGQPALDRFSDPEENMTGHHLVTNFKMALFDKKQAAELPLDALTLVALYLEQLLGKMFRDNLDISQGRIKKDEIAYYLTIPAIWADREKALMRAAAVKSGMVSEQNSLTHLSMILEPEAALVYASRDLKKKLYLEQGDVVLIVDAGGGTVDLTTHEMVGNGTYKEVCIGGGGPYGGMYVDKKFLDFVEEQYPDGQELLQKMKEEMPEEFASFIYKDWMMTKHNDDGRKNMTTIMIPARMSGFLKESISSEKLKVMKRKHDIYNLRLSREKIDNIFADVLESIRNEVDEQIQKASVAGRKINKMVLVGGFSHSPILRDMLINRYSRQMQVYSPEGPSKAIVMGAAWHGLSPIIVDSRVLRRTYGITGMVPFIEGVHSPTCKKSFNGTDYCRSGFVIFGRKGDSIGKDQVIKETFMPLDYFQEEVKTYVVTSDMLDPKDESDSIDKMLVRMHLPGKGFERHIDAAFKFGLTEVIVTFTESVTKKTETVTLSLEEEKTKE